MTISNTGWVALSQFAGRSSLLILFLFFLTCDLTFHIQTAQSEKDCR
jgi:hypothetical protein